MSDDIPVPKTNYPTSDTWDKMDKTDPYNMIMKVAALQAAAKVVLETPNLVRGSNSPCRLQRPRREEKYKDAQTLLEKCDKNNFAAVAQSIVNPAPYEQEDETTSDQEQEEYDALWKSIKACTNAENSWGLYEYKIQFRAPVQMVDIYKQLIEEVVNMQCKIDGGEIYSRDLHNVNNRPH